MSFGRAQEDDPRKVIAIPRVQRPPALEDFRGMRPGPEWAEQLARVDEFVQRQPRDGEPSTQRTEVYLGYDDEHLYVVFLCFDSEPEKIRARLSPRGLSSPDDWVQVMLDTFHDRRRAFVFASYPLGVQWDALWTEGQGMDSSWDTLYYNRAELTDQGYMVWLSIPFRSVRFSSDSEQVWGISLTRNIPRLNEDSHWPPYSSRIEGRLNQAGTLVGLRGISPGRNVQLLPFGSFRSSRALDMREPARPRFLDDGAQFDGGLDAKLVVKDSLVTDIAINPDFSQVESDEPQVTTNQRFEVFFPERRPFFLENASFFQTPINLFFSRRIADPQFGARMTGKAGPYAIGALLIDDESPGKRVPSGNPLEGKRARFAIARVNRDILKQSSIGAIFTERSFETGYNRAGGLDGRLKLAQNWTGQFQAVASATRFLDGRRIAGPAYETRVNRTGRQFGYTFVYSDRSPGFQTQTGFNPRSDIRNVQNSFTYRFRPEGKRLIAFGPNFATQALWDHSGLRLDQDYNPNFTFEFSGQTFIDINYLSKRERLRPRDFPLPENRDFHPISKGISFRSNAIALVNINASFGWGSRINILPAGGNEPFLADYTDANLTLTVRPTPQLTVKNSYLLARLSDRSSDASIFNNHIVRTNWNWQFTREISTRFILQYNSLLANTALTSLQPAKNFNADFLFTYQVNAWTALFAGFNTNSQNIALVETPEGSRLLRNQDRFINDGRQFFVKYSYLFRF
jgi:hypothetical protein